MRKFKRYERYKDSGVEWIGEIPEEWELIKIKHIGMLSAGGVNKKIEEGEELFKSVHYMDVYRNSGKEIGNSEDYLVISATKSQAKNCTLQKGDILFTSSSETPDDIGHALAISENLEQTLYGYHLIRLRLDQDVQVYYGYRKYMFNNYSIRSYFSSRAQGITRYGLKYDDYKDAVVFIPPINEQIAIANFLDQKTAEIDALIADKEKLIELLQEKRQAIITEAVTKGLNPNVRMKDSGVEWIGEIPEHWEVKPLFTLLTERKVRNIGNIEKNVLSLSYGRIIRRHIESNYGLLPESFETYQIVDPGNIILRLTDLQNDHRSLRCGLVTERGIITSAYVALESNSKINATYAYSLLHTYDLLKVFYGMGDGVRQSMSYKDLKWMPIILPPLYEQEAICNYISEKVGIMDDLMSEIKTQIQKLKEYRQSLISEAVTGKIDVRDYDIN